MKLNGWKEIAAHVRRGVRTVQRWEKDGLPVYKYRAASQRSPVFAYSEQLERWLARNHHLSDGGVKSLLQRSAELRAENRTIRQEVRSRVIALTSELSLLQKHVEKTTRMDGLKAKPRANGKPTV